MTQDNTADVLNYDDGNKPKLPSGLNVLTILTFIGSAILLVSSLFTFFRAKKSYEELDKTIAQMNSDNMPGWLRSLMGDPENLAKTITKSYENRIPILLLTLVGVGLCVYGALQMRQLKKQGYLFYIIGELLPFLTQVLFIGAFSLTGGMAYLGMGIALLFILLYTMQRKHLVY